MKIKHLPVLMGIGLGLVALAGCTTQSPMPPTYPPISFANEPAFNLNVGQIAVETDYRPPAGDNTHIELDMPVSPETALRRWVLDRLKPGNPAGADTIRVRITDAHAIETPLPVDTGLTSSFKQQADEHVDLGAAVVIEVLNPQQMVVANVTAHVTSARDLLQGISLNQRDQTLYDMTTDLMHQFDNQIGPQISANFGRWLAQ